MELSDKYENWVVVEDVAGEWKDGSLVGLQRARVLSAKGVTLLPVDVGLLRSCGVGGYVKRAWGSGVPLDFGQPRLTCPIALFGTPSHRRLRWVARLVASPTIAARVESGEPFDGVIQVTGDSSQRGTMHAGVRQESAPTKGTSLGPLDEQCGWVAEGAAEVSLAAEGIHGFGLYGNMPGVRVAWLSASLVDAA